MCDFHFRNKKMCPGPFMLHDLHQGFSERTEA